jgi:RNA polymerase sigma-70 factor (ECF subfamily)
MSPEISILPLSWHMEPPPRMPATRPVARRGFPRAMPETPTSEPEPDMSALLAEVGRSRDIERFELVFRHFAPRVKAYMARTGSAANAEELMQETMVAAWNKCGLYDPSKGAASTWLFSIARNLRIDAWRREKHPEFDPDDPALLPTAEPAADRRLEGEEQAVQVRAALEALPPDQAEVMRLAFYEDNSQSEIATALDLPLGTVKSRMRLAFGKLRVALRETGDKS